MTIIAKTNEVENKIIENLVLNQDLAGMNSQQKVQYVTKLCESLGLNPLTKPFQLIKFQSKEILYASKDCTEQLRKIHGVSLTKLEKTFQDGLYIVTVYVQDKTGRQDVGTGAVNIGTLKGDALANAIMKAESKAKRRATLSICGLGILDESETDTIGTYQKIDISNVNKVDSSVAIEEKMATKNQLENKTDTLTNDEIEYMINMLKQAGFTTKEAWVKKISEILGRNITSRNDISRDEMTLVIDNLKEANKC